MLKQINKNHRHIKFTIFLPMLLCLYSCSVSSYADKVAARKVEEDLNKQNPVQIGMANVNSNSALDSSQYIVPGRGTDKVFLGQSQEDLVQILGKPNDKFDHNGFCSYSEIHWFPKARLDGSIIGDGVFAFLKDGKVFEIRYGEGYYTEQRMTYGTSIKELQRKITAKLFRLHPSASTATNDEDLLFVVEKDKGIAYEIGASYRSKQRIVNAIYVFTRNANLLPWGCISKNQSFVEIKSTNP